MNQIACLIAIYVVMTIGLGLATWGASKEKPLQACLGFVLVVISLGALVVPVVADALY